MELKNEIIQLNHKLEIKNLENKMLVDSVERMDKYLMKSLPEKNIVAIDNRNSCVLNQKTDNPRVLDDYLNQVKEVFEELKKEMLKSNIELAEMLEDISNSIQSHESNKKKVNGALRKLLKILRDIGTKDSNLNKVFEGSEKIKKISISLLNLYNKIAPFVELPTFFQ
ncbi:hypothetical protein DMA11_24150 [Marinilabiliaceae bacterium JC017]|nr:hypothetical protein DMA11_24150 [Marinilabiliaceae bacterium JC017]